MKLSKVMLGLATVLCLTACGKGKECTIEDFAKEVKEIKGRSDLKKAVVSCEITIKTTKDGKTEKEVKKGKGEYDYSYASQSFSKASDKNDKIVDDWFPLMSATTRMTSNSTITDSEVDEYTKVTYHVKPFGIERDNKVDGKTHLDGTETINEGRFYTYFQWDEFGFLTKMEVKLEGTPILKSLIGEKYFLNEVYTISYK